jgi:hypothetical protein
MRNLELDGDIASIAIRKNTTSGEINGQSSNWI